MKTDTAKGASSAPLYNNQWQIVGIHHSAAEKRDDAGNILAIGGGQWQPEMVVRQKWWYANEGLRISRFIADVETQVEAALDSSVPLVAERIVAEAGYILFQAMLNLAQNRPSLPLSVATDNNPSVPTPQRRRFNPD